MTMTRMINPNRVMTDGDIAKQKERVLTTIANSSQTKLPSTPPLQSVDNAKPNPSVQNKGWEAIKLLIWSSAMFTASVFAAERAHSLNAVGLYVYTAFFGAMGCVFHFVAHQVTQSRNPLQHQERQHE